MRPIWRRPPLRGTGRFEALHLTLASPHRQMRVLGPIVLAQALFMASAQSHFRFCRPIRAQLVGHQHLRREALFLEQLAHQFHRCGLVAPSLHKQIENLAFVVDRAPQPQLPAANHHGHLVEMPRRHWARASTAKFSGEHRPELQDPSPHRFVGDIQPTLSEQVFDVAIAERETQIEPNSVPNNRRRKLVASRRDRHAPYPLNGCALSFP
jgi:hypothetical protein